MDQLKPHLRKRMGSQTLGMPCASCSPVPCASCSPVLPACPVLPALCFLQPTVRVSRSGSQRRMSVGRHLCCLRYADCCRAEEPSGPSQRQAVKDALA